MNLSVKKRCVGTTTKAKGAKQSGGRTRYRRSTLREIVTEMRQLESCQVNHHHIYAACEGQRAAGKQRTTATDFDC